MMWALNAAPIRSPEAQQLLRRYKHCNKFQSNLWLLPRHLKLFGVRALYPPQLLLPTNELLAAPLRAVPLSLLSPSTKRRILSDHPPPTVPSGRFILLERSPAVTRWRLATVEECFDAAFPQSGVGCGHSHLLCEPSFTECLSLPTEVAVLNAQETSNPFLVDPLLCHRSLVTGDTFQTSISSALTTVAAQFGYTSLNWVEARLVEEAGLRACASAAPHVVNYTESLRVVHVSQLPMSRQEELVDAVPRYVLTRSTRTSFVYLHGCWRPESAIGLTARLQRSKIPQLDDGELVPPMRLLLWAAVTANDAYVGPVMERERNVHCRFYNAQQLE
jgi:hypothetical protein